MFKIKINLMSPLRQRRSRRIIRRWASANKKAAIILNPLENPANDNGMNDNFIPPRKNAA